MKTVADRDGNQLDKHGLASTLRWGVGMPDAFYLSGYFLRNDNGINYGIPWLRQSSPTSAKPSRLIESIDPKNC